MLCFYVTVDSEMGLDAETDCRRPRSGIFGQTQLYHQPEPDRRALALEFQLAPSLLMVAAALPRSRLPSESVTIRAAGDLRLASASHWHAGIIMTMCAMNLNLTRKHQCGLSQAGT